jgi:hypothetical protein
MICPYCKYEWEPRPGTIARKPPGWTPKECCRCKRYLPEVREEKPDDSKEAVRG